jgi:predicted HAD superfamily hydrolase
MLMVGDNERSDVQIFCDMGASFLHLLKPLELARGLPRFSNLIVDHEHRSNCDAELTIGLVVRKNFAPIHYQNFDYTSLVEVTPYNWGYSLVGPLLVSFAHWLLHKARADGVQRLYFLSREGRIIKDVYDCWCEGEEDFPESDYLVASRRATGVAAISTLDDILEIARTVYYPNTLENFLITRYGLSLSDEQWEECARSFKMGRNALITVQNRQVRFLLPLLQALEPQIVARAENEKAAFLCYLADKGMGRGVSQAVVDIGYGGSVQGYLNRLLSHKVHGYYMMTDERSIKIARAHHVHLRGCFVENSSQSADAPVIYRDSFDLERLLSSNEPQVEYYELNGAGNLDAHFRPLSPVEQECAGIRNELQQGTMAYARDARQVRRKMLPDFQPSCWTAQMLMDAFLVQHSQGEKSLLSKIVLDDHYCGRDLVS